jgi:hypothetical protein
MPRDPSSIFGGLLARCISDDYLDDKKQALSEGVVFLVLGTICSVLTTYALSFATTLL